MKLSVNIPADGDRRPDFLSVGLLQKDVHSFFSDKFNLFFSDGLKRSEILDNIVDVDLFGSHSNNL
jgi:hypothetical protein